MLLVSFNLGKVLKYIAPYLHANLLATRYTKGTWPYRLNEVEAIQLGLALHRKYGFDPKPYNGVSKVCYLHTTSVIKIPIHEVYGPALSLEIDNINNRFPAEYVEYFPYTIDVGDGVAIQERCILDQAMYNARYSDIKRLAAQMGIEDTHSENVGFSMEDTPVIKFIDVQTAAMLATISDAPNTQDFWKQRELDKVLCK